MEAQKNSPETSGAGAPSSSSSAGCATPTTAGRSVAKRRERKKGKGEKWPARVRDSEDDTIGEAIKKLATEGEQMTSVMEQMQDSQAQQIQLMSQLVGCFKVHLTPKFFSA